MKPSHYMFDGQDIEADAIRVLDMFANGGIAIFPALSQQSGDRKIMML